MSYSKLDYDRDSASKRIGNVLDWLADEKKIKILRIKVLIEPVSTICTPGQPAANNIVYPRDSRQPPYNSSNPSAPLSQPSQWQQKWHRSRS